MPSSEHHHRRSRAVRGLTAGGAALALTVVAAGSAAAGTVPVPSPRPLAGPDSGTFPGSQVPLGDVDARGAAVAPLPAALADLRALGAGVSASWTQYGTPRTLMRESGWLATGQTGAPADAARAFLSAHHALFGLSTAEIADLEMWRDETLVQSDAHAVLFRQHVGGMPLSEDGLITVAIRAGNVAGITSSAVPSTTLDATTATVPAASAVLTALQDAGITGLSLADLTVGAVDTVGYTHVVAAGLAQVQRARLVALPTTTGPARLSYEVIVQDVAGVEATATQSYVDAVSGGVLLRHDAVHTAEAGSASSAAERAITVPESAAIAPAAPTGNINGSYTKLTCSTPQALLLDVGTTQVAVTAAASGTANSGDDIKIVLHSSRPGSSDVTGDNATSPEVATYTFTTPYAAGETLTVSVCPFDTTNQTGGPFTGNFVSTTAAAPASPTAPGAAAQVNAPAKYKFFQANPILGLTSVGAPAADNRATACGPTSTLVADPAKDTANPCTVPLQTPALPDAFDLQNGAPTLQTIGNNAVTTNAQSSTSLTPGAPATTYQSATRDYLPAFTDSWKSTQCNPTTPAAPNGADINASITNLFTGHNRIHDFSYRLGLNDDTGSLQTRNASGRGLGQDPELGNAQNAANTNLAITTVSGASGMALPVTGRNNANQVAEPDGVPGITNQYLFQPVLGFYGPCADGDLDSSIFLHEYTHAISNRLIAGPMTGLSGQQGGSMGESWSDLDAIEFLQAFDVAGKGGEDKFSVGAYATGDTNRGIRDYNLLTNPLTYGEFGFDTTGPEVHADGEIWNGIQIHVRQALVDLYNSKGISFDDKALQKQCALGTNTAGAEVPTFEGCPGNRRWIQYLYDSLILQSNGAPTMVDMKKTTLISVMMRNTAGVDSDDYKTVSEAFAQRGLGASSFSASSADTDPTPGFDAPAPNAADNARVTFSTVDADTGAAVPASVYVGTYTARATPLADTIVSTDKVLDRADMVAGAYTFAVQAPGYGITRVPSTTFTGGRAATVLVKLSKNLASKTNGAVAAAGPNRPADAFDDSEATDAGYNSGSVVGKTYEVDLKAVQQLQVFKVSAMHHVAAAAPDFQSRITDLRAFHLDVSSDGGATYRTVYRSAPDFFPGRRPRTLAPDVALRTIQLAAPVTADHLRLVVDSTQCTGAPDFAADQDADPTNNAACPGSASAPMVNVADIEAFGPSAVVADATPPAALPELGNPALLPVAALALLGGLVLVRRRRRA